jgi:MFS family permease
MGSFERRAKWWVLGLICLANFGSYYVYDAIASVVDLLHRQLGFAYADIGALNAVYSLPNVFIALLGGIWADRMGPARVSAWTAAICFVGTALTAVGQHLWLMVLGRFLFGVGGETLFVALLTGVGRWFIGPQLGIAMAVFFSVARIGSYFADLSPQLFGGLYQQWQPPLLLSAAVAGVSLLAALGYAAIERHRPVATGGPAPSSSTRLALINPGKFVWGLLLLAMLFYAIVFPFRSTFAIEYFQGAKGLSLQQAGVTNSWVFFAAIFASPGFGWLSDRTAHKTALLTVGMVSLTASFYILVATSWPLWISTVLVGLSYSLVPAVIWPAVSASVPEQKLGAILGLMTVLQNIGMAAVNFMVGWLNDQAHAGRDNPAGYAPMMWLFAALSLLGAMIGAWLWKRTSNDR